MSDRTKRKAAKAVAKANPKRAPTEREQAAIAKAREAHKARPARVDYIETPAESDGALRVDSPHSDEEGHPLLVADTFASTSNDFVGRCMLHLANVTIAGGKPSLEGLNASLALVAAIDPQDEFEAAMATQMAATHELSMEMLRRTKATDRMEGMREYGNLATKLSRTFAAQMKALSDWRRGGEEVVRHIHVNAGGRAVVAETINIGGRQNEKLHTLPHEPLAPVPGSDTARNGMPVPGDEGQETLPTPRRQVTGRTAGQ